MESPKYSSHMAPGSSLSSEAIEGHAIQCSKVGQVQAVTLDHLMQYIRKVH